MSKLKGREVLIVEDEPLISLEIARAFRKAGAFITTTSTLKQALSLVEHDGLAVAIVDHVLRDGDSTLLCERLTDRGIPFVLYSGFNEVEGACKAGALVGKPARRGRGKRRRLPVPANFSRVLETRRSTCPASP